MAGRRADALRAARDLHAVLTPNAHEFAGMVDPILSAHLFVALRFNDWVEVLAVPEPDPRLAGAHAVWHFGRAVARAATGDATGAAQEQAALAAARQQLPQGAGFGFNTAADILRLASEVLAARLATTRGDLPRALAHWEQAVAIEDTLTYNEPEDWYYPTRESLGAALLSAGRAADAEAVFRAELQRHPRNPRALFGLSESLRVQGKDAAAALVAGEFASAWQHADVKLRLPDL
jgi:tetratricopeptide (TPR) repeat protein